MGGPRGGPKYSTAPEVPDQLVPAYYSAFARADEIGAESLAFPSISTGAYDLTRGARRDALVEVLRTGTTQVKRCVPVAYSVEMANMRDYQLYDRW